MKKVGLFAWLIVILLAATLNCSPLEAASLVKSKTFAMSTDKPQEIAPQESREPTSETAPLPEAVSQAVKEEIARSYSLAVAKLQVNQSEAQTWYDGCLGLASSEEFCTQALVSGYRVIVTDGSQTWIYRTDNKGAIIRRESPSSN